MQPKICPVCGSPMMADAQFCTRCGSAYVAPQQPPVQPQATPPQPPVNSQQPYYAPQYDPYQNPYGYTTVPAKKKSNWKAESPRLVKITYIVYLLLSFLGMYAMSMPYTTSGVSITALLSTMRISSIMFIIMAVFSLCMTALLVVSILGVIGKKISIGVPAGLSCALIVLLNAFFVMIVEDNNNRYGEYYMTSGIAPLSMIIFVVFVLASVYPIVRIVVHATAKDKEDTAEQ